MESQTPNNYIYNFYIVVENLLIYVATYNNTLLKIKTEYKATNEDNIKKLPPELRNFLTQTAEQARLWVINAYTKYSALKSKIKAFDKESERIDKIYKEIISNSLPSFESLNEFSILMNKLFVEGIADKALTTATETFADISNQKYSELQNEA